LKKLEMFHLFVVSARSHFILCNARLAQPIDLVGIADYCCGDCFPGGWVVQAGIDIDSRVGSLPSILGFMRCCL